MTIVRTLAIAAATLAALTAVATPAAAQNGTGRLAATEARQDRQQARIGDGLTSGRINPREAARLDRQQARIDHGQTRLAADGNFSRRDHARISHRQHHASHRIARSKHNRR